MVPMNALTAPADHGRRSAAALLAAALPSLLGSVLLMRAEGLGSGLALQQVLTFVVAAAIGVAAASWWPRRNLLSEASLAVLLATSLFIPLLATDADGPRRWLSVGPLRLYIAPMVLPCLLLTIRSGGRMFIALVIAGVALLQQPDAAQASALAAASLVFVLTAPRGRVAAALAATVLAGLAVATWQRPDPLPAVPHVEGVLRLAARFGWLAGCAAVATALLPSVALGVAWTRRGGEWLAVAGYYATLVALAPLEVTPVPILGFGAGPIIGYVAVVISARRT